MSAPDQAYPTSRQGEVLVLVLVRHEKRAARVESCSAMSTRIGLASRWRVRRSPARARCCSSHLGDALAGCLETPTVPGIQTLGLPGTAWLPASAQSHHDQVEPPVAPQSPRAGRGWNRTDCSDRIRTDEPRRTAGTRTGTLSRARRLPRALGWKLRPCTAARRCALPCRGPGSRGTAMIRGTPP